MQIRAYSAKSQMHILLREGVKKQFYLGLCPKQQTPPTHRARLGLHKVRKKSYVYFAFEAVWNI